MYLLIFMYVLWMNTDIHIYGIHVDMLVCRHTYMSLHACVTYICIYACMYECMCTHP